ncbi:hypothetical protein [Methylovulum miyakonense]|uniref:hypothetical protein n=1 Tax=Methylovulum miyakonense TaxID=645578 RepID=UPI0003650FCC|nr:hypothetical protein [Methylovulum miyakonense]
MKVFKKISTVSYSFAIFSFLIFVIALLLILFSLDFLTGPKWSSIIPGLLTGFIIALFQAFLSWFEIKKIDEYDELKIKKILPDRKSSEYYGALISKAEKEIKVLGVTAQRFLEDFASQNPKAAENEKVLLKALEKKVKVQILVANKELLSGEDKTKAKSAEPRLKKLSSDSRTNEFFEYACYTHAPAHSIVIIDEECIVGPIFPNVSSRYTPAIHLKRDSQFAKYYIEYFESEWEEWKNNQAKIPD